jgi:antitoxin (DNA-binding transcriptional repressor) of toxin-antitoxin stability system
MIQTVSVEELHNRIDELLARARSAGDEVIVSEGGTPVLRVEPIGGEPRPRQPRKPGSAKGQFVVPDDFDDPLPDDIVESFYQ